jgi:S1-C subfamily serine protease
MFLALALWIAGAPEPPPNAVAWVRAENDSAGSGFVIDADKRLLVTCRHVVADRTEVDVFFQWVRNGALVTDKREYLRNRAELRAAKLLVTGTVLKTRDETDLALVQLDALPPGTRALALAARVPAQGDVLRVIGHRLDLDTVWNETRGPVRARGPLADGYFWRGKKLGTNAHVLIAQLPTEEGDSGGPALDARGEVVGMCSALRRQCPLAAVCISARAIRAFLGADEKEEAPADALHAATVWLKPTATDVHTAGALVERDLVLTCARGLALHERVGVALPLRERGAWVSARGAYRDPLALHLKGAWRSGTVIARDAGRDLALVKLDAECKELNPLPLAATGSRAGDAVQNMSHPAGLEFAWALAAGTVRQRGSVQLDSGENAPRVSALLLQLPAQSASPGGPITNAKGELIGVLSARESAQMVGYCASIEEVRAFLDVAPNDRPPKTLAGLVARLDPLRFALAAGLAQRAEAHRAAGRFADAKRDADGALAIDSGCAAARVCRARMLDGEAALAELDAVRTFDRAALLIRAQLALGAKDARRARGDADRVLSAFPADADARTVLARAQFALGDDAKAATAFADVLRTDPKRLAPVARELLSQADALAQKFPDSPGVPADWLAKVLAACAKHEPRAADALQAATGAKTDKERLGALRNAVEKLR